MSGILSGVKRFFSVKFNVFLVIALLLLGAFAFFLGGEAPSVPSGGLVINFFYLPTCPHCTEQKPIIAELEEEFPDIPARWHDASTSEGSALFYQMAQEAGLDTSRLAVPTIFLGQHAFVGLHTKEQLLAAIEDCKQNCEAGVKRQEQSQGLSSNLKEFDLPFLGRTDLTAYSLPVLAVILGLIDGFNPCAMWVLVYLISVLVGLNDRRKIWLIVGSFVAASGILYFLFMTAWINIFLLIGYMKLLTLLIGMVALGGGILSLKEYITAKGDLTCEVGDAESHRKTMKRIDRIVSQPLTWALTLSIIGLAFVVNSVEFVCSAAIPAVFTQILALSSLTPFQHYTSIALYTVAFMLDDLLIFGLAAFAISTTFGSRYAKYCRLFGGVIMSVLGLILLFAPHLLR